jgi:hypothetical protein
MIMDRGKLINPSGAFKSEAAPIFAVGLVVAVAVLEIFK